MTNQSELTRAEETEIPVVSPAVTIFEDNDAFVILSDLPGVDANGLHLRLEDGELRLEATRSSQDRGVLLGGDDDRFAYRRRFKLPKGVDADRAQADLRDGVLRLTLPKLPALRPREIPVQTG